MGEDKSEHVVKLPIDAIDEPVDATPQVSCSTNELIGVLLDLSKAVDERTYIPQTPTKENFVGKVLDLSKGAEKRKQNGYPQEYLYVFKYPCKLKRRDAEESGITSEQILIYIKINDRKIP